jgi:hypothetical protein
MNFQGSPKRANRGKQALLQIRQQQLRGRLRALRRGFQPCGPQIAVLAQQGGQAQLRCPGRQPFDILLHHVPFGKATGDLPKIFLQTPHNDFVSRLLSRLHTAHEMLRDPGN